MTTAAYITTAGRAALLGGLVMAAGVAGACAIPEASRYPGQEKLNAAIHDLLENKRVRQAADCSWTNGGKNDYQEGAGAIDLGKGRVGQMIGHGHAMLVSVCAEHQVVILEGLITGEEETTCGWQDKVDLTALDPTSGKFDFHAGRDFAGFMAYVKSVGMRATEDLDRWIDRESQKDQVNLLCGCQVFYPETMN